MVAGLLWKYNNYNVNVSVDYHNNTLDLFDVNVTDLCLSNTAGHIDVGGKIMLADSPSVHSALTDAAQRLCSYSNLKKDVSFDLTT